MSWSPDYYINAKRPWPTTIKVMRINTKETRKYVPERTCHEVLIDKFFHGCSECGYMWEFMYNVGARVAPKSCPNCGARVVDE